MHLLVRSLLTGSLVLGALGATLARPAMSAPGDAVPSLPSPPVPPSEQLTQGLAPGLQQLIAEVFARSPEIARVRHAAAAAAARAPQVGTLPDPMASLTWFALSPETRVGPQEWGAGLSQSFPWLGKLDARERAALWAAAAAEAAIETTRLDLLTRARRLFYELAYLEREESIVRTERQTLERLEEAARARYSAGMGLQQEILRTLAQITRTDERLLRISERQIHVLADLNALRDRPADAAVDGLELPRPAPPAFLRERLLDHALTWRPDLLAAEAEVERTEVEIELARLAKKPDFTVGLSYTSVGRRDDLAGRLNPPEGNGDDVLGLTGSFNLPVRRGRLDAMLEEALERRSVAEEQRRLVRTRIESQIGDLATRIPLMYEHWELLERVLLLQAREALSSAEAAYTTGKLNAVDLLDAEVVLLEVQTGAARTAADYAIALAELERAAVLPLATATGEPNDDRR